MSITFNNGFGFGASGGGNSPYGTDTWKLTMSIAESNTTGIIFSALPNGDGGPGYATGWDQVNNMQNGGATLWEYIYLSSKEFSSPQTNLSVEGDTSFNALNDPRGHGINVIGDALVGVSSSPTLDNTQSAYESSTYSTQFSFTANDATVIVISAGVESGPYAGVPRNITSINGLGLTWSLRKKYLDPDSNCGQQSEIWYAINNTGNSVSGTITIIYDSNFDDQATIISSWSGCNLSSPWTSSNSSTSNRNTAAPPAPTPTPTPTPSPMPLSQYNPNGTNGPYGLLLNLDGTVATSGTTILDQSTYHNNFTWSGNNPYNSTYYAFTGGTIAQSNSTTYFTSMTNSLAMTMWVNFTSISGGIGIISKTPGANRGWALRYLGGQFNLVKYNVADQYSNGSYPLSPNTWYHIAVIQGGTSLTYMVNGQIISATNSADNSAFNNNSDTVQIGYDPYAGYGANMKVGMFRIYDAPLADSSVLTEFNNTKAAYGY